MCISLAELKQKIENEETISPTDISTEWKGWCADQSYSRVNTETKFIAVDDIVGTAPQNTNRLEKHRLVKIINKIVANEWKATKDPVVLEQHPNGELYVSSDGNHRILAHKLLNIDHIYAKITKYE